MTSFYFSFKSDKSPQFIKDLCTKKAFVLSFTAERQSYGLYGLSSLVSIK